MPKMSDKDIHALLSTLQVEAIADGGKRVPVSKLRSGLQTLSQKPNADLAPPAPFRFLASQGGGAKGATYLGALKRLKEAGELDSLESVAGASAGAITAFLLGLGFNPEQIAEISKDLNFLDFNDYQDNRYGEWLGGGGVRLFADALISGAAFKGENFHDWAGMWLEKIAGDPDITFKEFERLGIDDPLLLNMIFKATQYQAKDHNAAEWTFSSEATPDVPIRDALRASMAFPGAFLPWPVRSKNPDNTYSIIGYFADGGILTNFPLEVFDSIAYSQHDYPIYTVKYGTKNYPVNPCTLGLSLAELGELDAMVTPIPERLVAANEEAKHSTDSTKRFEENTGWRLGDIVKSAIWSYYGRAQVEDLETKLKTHPYQVVQIYAEGASTLDFGADIEKLMGVGYAAANRWLRHVDRENTYYPEYDDSNTKEEQALLRSDPTAYYRSRISKHCVALFTSLASVPAHNPEFKNRTRVKFHAYHIESLLKEASNVKGLDVNTLLQDATHDAASAFDSRCVKIQEGERKRWEHIHQIKQKDELNALIKSNPQKAIRYAKGYLTNLLELLSDSKDDDSIIANLVATDQVLTINEFLVVVENQINLKRLQGRFVRHDLSGILNYSTDKNLMCYMLDGLVDSTKQDLKGTFQLLVKKGYHPLQIDKHGKNAFHYAIEMDNADALQMLLQYCKKNKIDISQQRYGMHQQTLGHYLVSKSCPNIIACLAQERGMTKQLMSIEAEDIRGVSVLEQAAHSQVDDSPCWELLHSIDGSIDQAQARAAFEDRNDDFEANMRKLNSKIQVLEAQGGQMAEKMSDEDCFDVLRSTYGDGPYTYLDHLAEIGQVDIAYHLLNKLMKSKNYSSRLVDMLGKKHADKTPLYIASEHGQMAFVKMLIQDFRQPINQAGPFYEPDALTIAAKSNAYETVLAIMESWSYLPADRTRRACDHQGKHALHYIAQHPYAEGTPESRNAVTAFNAVLFGGGGPKGIANILDSQERSVFRMLVDNHRLDILKQVEKKGLRDVLKGQLSQYYLDDIFDFHTPRANGKTDLQYAFEVNPELAEFVVKRCRYPKKAAMAKKHARGELQVREEHLNERRQAVLAQQAMAARSRLTNTGKLAKSIARESLLSSSAMSGMLPSTVDDLANSGSKQHKTSKRKRK